MSEKISEAFTHLPLEMRPPEHIRNHKLARAQLGILAMTAVAIPTNLYWQDVNRNIEIQENASMSIDIVAPAADPENNRRAIVSINGFGSYDATEVAEHLGLAVREVEDAQLLSVVYGNAPLEPEAISQRIVDKVDDEGIEEVIMLGYSAGGDLTMQSIPRLVSEHVPVTFATLVSVPNGIDGLQQTQVEEIAVASIIKEIPGATHSTAVRFLGEMYFRRDRYEYENPIQFLGDIFTTADAVIRDLDNDKLPGTWLLIDQVNIIADSDIQQDFEDLTALGDHIRKPVFLYLGTTEPGRDYVVQDDKSGNEICQYAYEAGFSCFKADVPGAIHTRPDLMTEEYIETVRSVAPVIQAAIARSAEEHRRSNLAGSPPEFR